MQDKKGPLGFNHCKFQSHGSTINSHFAYGRFQKPIDSFRHSTISRLHCLCHFFGATRHLPDGSIKHSQQRWSVVLQSQQAGEFHACHASQGVLRSSLEKFFRHKSFYLVAGNQKLSLSLSLWLSLWLSLSLTLSLTVSHPGWWDGTTSSCL